MNPALRNVSITASDSIALAEDFVVLMLDQVIRIGGDSGRNVTVDAPINERITSSITARPRYNEANSLEVGRLLLERLNLDTAGWANLREYPEQNSDIDCILGTEITQELKAIKKHLVKIGAELQQIEDHASTTARRPESRCHVR